jgi:hypothetical protein
MFNPRIVSSSSAYLFIFTMMQTEDTFFTFVSNLVIKDILTSIF